MTQQWPGEATWPGENTQRAAVRSAPLPRGKFGAGIEMAALRDDPNLQVTGRERSAVRNRQVGGVSNSAHLTDNARDFAPRRGETLQQAQARLNRDFAGKGYKVIVEGAGAKHSTGPHLHVEATADAQTLDDAWPGQMSGPWPGEATNPGKRAQSTPAAPRPQDTRQPPQRAQRPANQAPKAKEEGWSDLPGNIIPSAVKTVKGFAHAVRHPIETAEGIGDFAGGALAAGMDKLGIPGVNARGKKAEAGFRSAVDPWLEHPGKQLKKSLVEDPVGTALTVAPVGGAIAKGAKLGIRGVDAARLATLTPEARTALRAKRVEDAAVATRYKNVARPIMARHRLDAERAADELRKHQKTVGNLPAAEQRKLAMAADTGDRTGIAPEHHEALDAVRKVAKDYDKRIHDIYAKGGHSIPEFMDNYYTHLWKENAGDVRKAMGRQGSGRNLKARKIPTLADGLRAGLTPKYENMLDTMTHYAHTMSAHLVNHDLMNAMRKDSTLGAKFVSKRNIPEGMRRVEGIGTEREGRGLFKEVDGERIHTGNAPPMVLAAKSKAAELYNRRIGKSVMDNQVGRGVKRASGAVVALKLASFYHPTLIAGKAVASDLGNGLRHLTRGAPVEAAKALAHMPFAPALTARQGAKMGARLMHGETNEVDKLYVEAGGSAGSGGLAPYHAIDRPSMAESAMRGTFKSDFKRSFDEASVKGVAKGVIRTALRAADSLNDLVFKHYVPAIKRGAFERELVTSLKAHPEWTDAEKLKEARNVLSSVEGRMGLVTKDNLFWHNTAHDIGRVIFLSPSWQLGNARILHDAMKGIPKEQKGFFHGKGITNGKAQAAGLVGSYMLGNAILNYLYTGERPTSADLMAARTGGKNKDGSDERVTPPSVVPELWRWFKAPEEEAGNVLNPAIKTQWDLGQNRDFADRPIYRPDYASPWPHSRPHDIASYELGGATPIPLSGQDNDKSKVGALARIAGLRPAGKSIANPEGYASMRRSIADRQSASTVKRERQEDAKRRKRK